MGMPCWHSARMGPNRGFDPGVGSWKDIALATSVHDVGVRGAAEAFRGDALARWRLVRAHGVPRDGSLKGMGQVHPVYPSQNRQPYQLAHHILARVAQCGFGMPGWGKMMLQSWLGRDGPLEPVVEEDAWIVGRLGGSHE